MYYFSRSIASQRFATQSNSMRSLSPLLLLILFPLFLLPIDFPSQPAGEEIHYVRAARAWLATGADSNLEHPPLAKLLIATGIAVAGDQPLGWRIMSALFGALALIGMFYWSLALFNDRRTAWWTVVFTTLNLMLWTEAHLATLEIFQVTLTIGACAVCSRLWRQVEAKHESLLAASAGLLFGLALACKWFAVVAWVACLLISTIVLARRNSSAKTHVFVWLTLMPLLIYVLSYTPYIAHQGIARWLGLQSAMWIDQTDANVVTTAATLSWWQWPLVLRPGFWASDLDLARPLYKTLMLIANPAVVWGGAVAILWSAVKRNFASWIAAAFPVLFFMTWAVIPHKHQHYYYFFPAVMALALPLANFRSARRYIAMLAAAIFVYYFPVVSGFPVPFPTPWNWLYSDLGVSN